MVKESAISRGRGRPRIHNIAAEKADAAIQRVRAGLPIVSALVLSDVRHGDVANLLNKMPALRLALSKAEAEFEFKHVQNIENRALTDAKFSQWLLERRQGDRWLPVSRTEITGKDGGALQSLTISKTLLASVGRAPDPEPRNVTASALSESKSTGSPLRIVV
jgi:hypothetical protein